MIDLIGLTDEEALAAIKIEEAILHKEIKVRDRIWGIDRREGKFHLSNRCACPIGIYLVNEVSSIENSPWEEAANLLNVSGDWMSGFVQGFDDVPFYLTGNDDAYLRGYGVGQQFRQEYLKDEN